MRMSTNTQHPLNNSSQLGGDGLVNNDVDNGWGLVQNEKIDDLTRTLKQLVKYDGNLFEIFSKIQIKKDHPNQLGINNNVMIENNIISDENKLDLSGKPNIVKQHTPTVEEKIDYIMDLYKKNPFEANYQMFYDTGDLLNFIFVSLSEEKDNIGYEFEKFKNKYTPYAQQQENPFSEEQDKEMEDINGKLEDGLHRKLLDVNSDLSKNIHNAEIDIEKRIDSLKTLFNNGATTQVNESFEKMKKVLASTDLKNEDSSNLSSKTATDKNKSFWRYACSFLKNIFLDLTLIYPVCEIFLSISNLNNIEMQTKQLNQQVEQQVEQLRELNMQSQISTRWMILGDQIKQQMKQQIEQQKRRIDEAARKIFKQISNKKISSILNAIVCTPSVLLVCSLIFAWGPVFSYVFLFASSALLIYKSVKRYRQERRKYFAAKAIQYFKPENSSIEKQFFVMLFLLKANKEMNSMKEILLFAFVNRLKTNEDHKQNFDIDPSIIEEKIDNDMSL